MLIFSKLAGIIKDLLSGPTPATPAVESPKYNPDPLDPYARHRPLGSDSLEGDVFQLRSVDDDVVLSDRGEVSALRSGQLSTKKSYVGDSAESTGINRIKSHQAGAYGVPEGLMNWYISQGFVGWQACALLAQHWLVNKACSQAGQDATRHGYEFQVGDGTDVESEVLDRIKEIDEDLDILGQLCDMSKFTNVFGIRVVIFDVEYDDELAYEKPFNIDAVKPGSYKGLKQIDPYWTAPLLDTEAAADPRSQRFYKPTWWIIGGKKYHWTHLHVAMGPEVSDILKPSYYYGGMPLTQRVYERVYAAERTANEAPLLAMSKRTTTLHVDIKKAVANQNEFEKRLAFWIANRDNHGVKVLGLEEQLEESDTALSDFDSVVMNQYQLVAAIAEVPATKLLGTSPKGFNATGEYEAKSYHEKLETIQSTEYNPVLNRHYELLVKSEGWDFHVSVVWNPVDSKTAEQLAELNERKANTGKILIEGGTISPDEERERVRNDKNSGYVLGDEEASTEFMDPENAPEGSPPGAGLPTPPSEGDSPELNPHVTEGLETGGQFDTADELLPETPVGEHLASPLGQDNTALISVVTDLLYRLQAKRGSSKKAGRVIPTAAPSVKPTVTPSIQSELQGVVKQADEKDLPKTTWGDHVIAIENPAGTYRAGKDDSGKSWRSRMPHSYGYIVGTTGADGDGMDVFMGPDPDNDTVHVINQINPDTGDFDEHKIMIGFGSPEEAQNAYHKAYTHEWKGFGDVQSVPVSDFNSWLGQGDLSKPFHVEQQQAPAKKLYDRAWSGKS